MKNTNRILAILLGIAIIYFIYLYMLNIIGYILIAWVLSMMGKPIMNFFLNKLKLSKLKSGYTISALIVMLIYFVFFFLFFVIVLPPILNQLDILAHLDYEKVFEPLQKPLASLQAKLIDIGLLNPEDVSSQNLKNVFLKFFNVNGISTAFSSIINFAGNILVGIFSVAFISFFFLKDSEMFGKIITSLVPERFAEKTTLTINEISGLLRRYFGGIALQVIILMTFVFTFLTILGIKDALIIAFFAAIINVIPYIGPVIGAAFGTFIVFTNNLGMDFYDVIIPKLIKVIITFMSMQMLDNYILQPMIYSDKIKAHPLEIFIVILVGANIYGILGMVLAIPVFIVIRAIAKVFFSNFRVVKKITEIKN